MKVRWLVKFNDRDVGFVGDVPDNKGANWIGRGMVEKFVEVEKPRVKMVEKPPKDKMVRQTRNK